MSSTAAIKNIRFYNGGNRTEGDAKMADRFQENPGLLKENGNREENLSARYSGNNIHQGNNRESVLDPFGCWEFII